MHSVAHPKPLTDELKQIIDLSIFKIYQECDRLAQKPKRAPRKKAR